MKKPELLSPCGDLECLKSAVQNGADSVYLGASGFNARARAKNFDMETLKEAICYAKLRNVKVHVTLNILIKNNEFEDAAKLAVDVYNAGADALIVQDLGLIQFLLKHYPEIPIHASTQMTTHNLAGVKQLENMGIKRVVLSRELSIDEISNICQNSNIEIETFIHGALCISYSGQCLFSSIVGGRSGNRGLCAQPCRLPYSLINEDEKILDKGYLLSPKDLNSIQYLPELIKARVSCFKIEGRLKSPEYVGIITRVYRKYIDLIWENKDASCSELLKMITAKMNQKNENTNLTDLEEITQVFNRGGFSNGHLLNTANKDLVFTEKSNNSGFYLGKIEKFNPNKGYITLKAMVPLNINDKIGIDSDSYTVSELMIGNKNIKEFNVGSTITIGRVKGENIKIGKKVYKLQSKLLNDSIAPTFKEDKEFKKLPLNCALVLKENMPIKIDISCDDENSIYYKENVSICSSIVPSKAQNQPTSLEKIKNQISKTGNTPFVFEKIDVDLEEGLFIPVSSLNELRRTALETLQNNIIQKHISAKNLKFNDKLFDTCPAFHADTSKNAPKINLLLNSLDENFDYTKIFGIQKIFIPLKYFLIPKFKTIVNNICNKFDTYLYMPSIIRDTIHIDISKVVNSFKIKGAVISSINQIDMLAKYDLKLIGNYTLNVYNCQTISTLQHLGISELTLSPELNDDDCKKLISSSNIPFELMVYGNIPLMTMNYCLLGKSNKCYSSCKHLCEAKEKFYIKDRMNLNFRIVPDNLSTITTIYNSKITSFEYNNFNVDSVRISILDEEPSKIQNIINTVSDNKRFEGNKYCGHFNKFEAI